MKHLLHVLCIISLMLSAWQCTSPSDDTSLPKITVLEKQVGEAGNSFAMKLFPAVNAFEKDKNANLMISPLSISVALSMAYNGAKGETQEAMADVMAFGDLSVEDVNTACRNLIDYLQRTDPKVLFEAANSMWIDQTFLVKEDFKDVIEEAYQATVSTLDFRQPEALDIINGWVKDKTHDKIEKILDRIPYDAVLYLINALYFKGTWTYEFDPDLTEKMDFTSYDGTVSSVDMMVQKGEFLTFGTETFQAVDLPYGKGKYSMTIILPSPETDINTFIADMDQTSWNEWFSLIPDNTRELELYLPRFTFDYSIKLRDVLIALGMGNAFNPDIADFSGINADPYQPVCISEVYHNTYIQVNEEGTEAAAVTAVEFSYTSVGPVMTINRPFIFAIRESDTGTIVFMGKVAAL